MRHDLAAMIPEPLPDGLWIVYLTGVFEIAGAVGLLVPKTRRLAGIGLALLLIAQFPANVNAALNSIPLGGEAPTPLWLRTPMQLLFIAMVWWTSITARPGEAQRQPTLAGGRVDGAGHASVKAGSDAGTGRQERLGFERGGRS